jgi:HEAT repeat protein
MTRFLNKLFNIRSEEWPRLLLLYGMLLAITLGAVWGETIVAAAFLEQVGLRGLPWFFMVRAIISIPAVAIYTAFADRIASRKLLIAILLIGSAGVVVGFGLLNVGLTRVAYPLLYLLIYVPLTDILTAHWFTYINGFYDTRAAKRIVPVLGTAGSIGGIIAGLSMESLNKVLSPNSIIIVWLSMLGVMALGAWLMPRIIKSSKDTASTGMPFVKAKVTEKARISYLNELREGYHYVTQSRFLRWIASGTLVVVILITFIGYQTSEIIVEKLQTTEAMANFYGLVTGIANLIMLPFQLFFLSRIIGWIGIGNAYLMFPIGNLAICAGLVFLPGLPIASFSYFDTTSFYGNIGYQINSLLYNAVPLRIKGRAHAFIDGLVAPIGAFIGSILLLPPFVALRWFLPTLTLALAVGYIANALIVRRQYGQALVKMLEQEDYSFLLTQNVSDLTVADPATLSKLREKLESSSSHELTVFMAKLISQIGGRDAIPILSQTAHAAPEAHTRAAILDVLAAADLRGDAVRELYLDFLSDPSGQVRQSAIVGLQQLSSSDDPHFLSRMSDMVNDPDIDVRGQALTALVQMERFYTLKPAVDALEAMLTNADARARAYGVRILGQIKSEHTLHRLTTYLADPSDQVRLEAALAVETAVPKASLNDIMRSEIEDAVSALLKDPVERARQAASAVLGRVGSRKSYPLIIKALTDASAQVRETAATTLVALGKSIIPVIHPQLDAPEPQMRKMTAVVLSRINPKEFGPLIVGANITGNLLAIYGNYGLVEALAPCSTYPGLAVLQSALREQSQRLTSEIFYLLSAIQDPNSVDIINDALRSENPRTRANAVEALESLTTPKTAELIAPLFEPETPTSKLLELSKETWDMEAPDTVTAIRKLAAQPDNPWMRTMTTYALGELGAALAPKTPSVEAKPAEATPVAAETDRRQRRIAPTDLFGALDAPKANTPKTETEPERPTRRKPPTDLFGALDATPKAAPSVPEPVTPSPAATLPNIPLTLAEIEGIIETALKDPVEEVRLAAQTAKRMMAGVPMSDFRKEEVMLSAIEKIIFLKEVPFFQGMTIDQLKILANVCEEEMFEEDQRVYNNNDTGGVLYVVVNGRVGIEQEKRTGSFARLATIEAHSYFGEANFFDDSPHTTSAVAIQDTLTLRLRREPLIALARQNPEMSLALINVLSERLRESNDRIAELTRARPRQLNKLFDQYD